LKFPNCLLSQFQYIFWLFVMFIQGLGNWLGFMLL
jgi:hypothetical protein